MARSTLGSDDELSPVGGLGQYVKGQGHSDHHWLNYWDIRVVQSTSGNTFAVCLSMEVFVIICESLVLFWLPGYAYGTINFNC